MSFRRQFYRTDNPTNSVMTLKDNDQSTRSKANPTRLNSLKGKEEHESKYSTMKTEDSEALG